MDLSEVFALLPRPLGRSAMPLITTSYVTCHRSPETHYAYVMNDGLTSQSFADLIRTAREAKGWSQEQLEQATADGHGEHVSVSTISRWERGHAGRPEPAHVRMACRALGIDPRRAAVALGYLTPEELGPPAERSFKSSVEEVLRILEDTAVPEEEKARWIDYLRYLQDRYRGGHSNAS